MSMSEIDLDKIELQKDTEFGISGTSGTSKMAGLKYIAIPR